MYRNPDFIDVLAGSAKAARQVEDVLSSELEAGRIAAVAPAIG
ncbi:MAG: hypothetical protein ABIW83_02320 [Allosphingosinicella sp.]